MKQLKSGIYKASNVTFDPSTLSAYSYKWWRFVAIIDGLVVFNNYKYSPTTGRHQYKVRSLLNELGIKIDIEMPLPRGIRHDQTLYEMIIEAEETECEAFLYQEAKRDDRNIRTRIKRLKLKLEDYLENTVAFRDYEIKEVKDFGLYNKIAVHQIVEDIEQDVNNAIYNFQRDAFGCIVFYVGA
jgi:hypothetical protein